MKKNQRLSSKAKRTLLAFLSLGLGACSTFATTTEVPGVTYVHFDDRFPSGMLDYLQSCHSSLILEAGQKKLALKGDCNSPSDLTTTEGKALYAFLGSRTEHFTPLKKTLRSTSGVHRIDHFPMKDCKIKYSADVIFKQLRLTPTATRWDSLGDHPTFAMDFTHDATEVVAELQWRRNIDCPSRLKEKLVAGSYGVFFPESTDLQIRLQGLKITLADKLISQGTFPAEIKGKLKASVTFDSMTFSSEDFESSMAGSILDRIGQDLESTIEKSLSVTAQSAADALASAVPQGHSVCSMQTRSETSMMIKTDYADESTLERCRNERIEL